MSTSAPQLPAYQPPAGGMPAFVPANPQAIESQAVSMDQQSYGLSDADFKQRYPQLANAQNTFLNNLNTQMSGNISPQMENVMTTAGLGGAVGSTGNWSLGSGTAGMSNIARNLGLDQMNYQNQLMNQFQVANNTFQPRTFGISGGDTAQIALSNLAGQNNWNQANYASQVQQAQFAAGQGAQQAALSANASNANTSTAVSGGTAALAVAAIAAFTCFCAISAFNGEPQWKAFRFWMLSRAPTGLRKLYQAKGQRWARGLDAHSWLKPLVRMLMRACMSRQSYVNPGFALI
jgi:hypothetical protein